MEGAEGGIILSSGMAAVSATFLALLKNGDHVLGGDQLYGRSLRLMTEELPRQGISTSFVDPTDAQAVERALTPQTKMILLEVVSNPTLRVADIPAIAALTKKHGILLVIDNTFTTPRGFQPFEAGADIVIHSVTKMLAGHSDAMLGYVAAKDPAHRKRIYDVAVTYGFSPSPFDCWLAERGLYTFALRYDRAEENAARLADALGEMPGVVRVLYPTRADHPDLALTQKVLGQHGGHMVSFEIAGGRDATNALVAKLNKINFAPTLGDVNTTLSHPASSSHRALTVEARAALGMSEGFFRVSVGVEPISDLIAQFEAALGH
ncbi:UNVERIFIED_CONTAM: hypothetical protein GTU68_055541 [Idotea baltica]|nr:hypothetical protein [Idotea baltica]